ncbi:MAG: PAS domain-containing protein [Deltaproteobacteria bacterium]|jgi:nitrogen fixation/metabolism regulation signal transduction histidine kinase|nr:PAS domain-containing protein [Deltaproteobacteria bacterium]
MRILENEINTKSPPGSWLTLPLEWDQGLWLRLFDGVAAPVLVYRGDGKLLMANKAAEDILGVSSAQPSLPDRLHVLVSAARVLDPYGKGRELTFECGGPVSMLLTPVFLGPFGHAVVATGINGEPPMALETDKAPADGDDFAMAGEMSKRVRGPLAGIELYASIIEEELDGAGDSELASMVDAIRYGVREANECLTSLESMTQPLSLELGKVDLAELVDGALSKLNGLFKANGIGVLVEQRELEVEADRKLISQMLLNILINAAEAMPNGGRLTVGLGLGRSGEAELVISDTGPGINPMDAKKLFNPFHTTKNQPLGLGLPVSRRIAEAHQGRLVLGGGDKGGARVKVVLPRIPDTLGQGIPN